MIKSYIKKLIILAVLVIVGILLDVYGLLDADKLLNSFKYYIDSWWLILLLILVQMILFTFGLAGSLIFWVVAPLYPPTMATFILAAGATLGGLGAYYFSGYMTDEWVKKVESSHAYKLLHKQDNFFMLFALRVFPAFPHALVNFSSGILRVKITHFILAAILGVGIKSYIYADVIYSLTTTASVDDLLKFSTIAPLVLLSLLTLLGLYINHRLQNKEG